MKRVLVCWIGNMDLKGAAGKTRGSPGPIARAIDQLSFDAAVLLSDHRPEETRRFERWLTARAAGSLEASVIERNPPGGSNNISGVHQVAGAVVQEVRQKYGPDAELTYHLSPGTPVMAAVWLLLAATDFPATLIESSDARTVNPVDVPYRLRAVRVEKLVQKQQTAYDWLASDQFDKLDLPVFHYSGSKMRDFHNRVLHLGRLKVPILVTGETGTGKEVIARTIHAASGRPGEFEAVNCGAIPVTLLESELFGHVRGAFTGATRDHTGVFERANNGTLFLDEIGEMPLELQVKLLRVLDNGQVTKVGGDRAVEVDIRLLCATNRELDEEVSQRRFREDLLHRIDVERIEIPPLRHREDLGDVIESALRDVCREYAVVVSEDRLVESDKVKRLTPDAKLLLLGHRWPGNYRDLAATLTRAVIWTMGETITAETIQQVIRTRPSESECGLLDRNLDRAFSIWATLDDVKAHYVRRALLETNGRKGKAAGLLGISRPALNDWIKTLGLGDLQD